MPRYFFNIYDHVRECDEDGVELDGPAEARTEAVTFAGDFLSEHPELLDDNHKLKIEVRDEAGKVVVAVVIATEG